MILHYLSLIELYKSICTIRDDIKWVSINVFLIGILKICLEKFMEMAA